MTEIKAYIITIGDEILIGQVSDTNAPYLSKSLTKLGISVVGKASIPDEPNALIKQLDFAKQSADLVLITGGLGPTKDDKTKQTIAQYFDDELVLDQASLDKTTALITALGSKMNSLNVRQAYRPSKATLLYNTIGTADGWSLSTAESCTGGYIASQITALSGSSAYFKGSVVAYDASVKSSILGLTSEDMSEGLVSESVALKMAMGVQRQLKSDVTIATTGAAGPLPSPVDKVPVGTVCVAIVAADYQWTKTLFFPHFDREDI
ncbi:unnamed protein product, partial [Notodromas monacha]